MAALWHELLDWFWRSVAWVNAGNDLIFIVAVLGLILLYIVFRRRR